MEILLTFPFHEKRTEKVPYGNSVLVIDYADAADHNTSPDLIKGQGVKTFWAFLYKVHNTIKY